MNELIAIDAHKTNHYLKHIAAMLHQLKLGLFGNKSKPTQGQKCSSEF